MWITTQNLPRYPVSKASLRERKLLENLENYIFRHEKDITSILLRLWRDQMIVLTLKTVKDWVNRRDVTDADMKDFRGDYQRLAEKQLAPVWRRIMDDAVSPENPQFDWAEKYSRGGGNGRTGGSGSSHGGFAGTSGGGFYGDPGNSSGGFSGFGGFGGSGGGSTGSGRFDGRSGSSSGGSSNGLPPLFPRAFDYHPQKNGVRNWITNHTAELVTNATDEQKKAIKAVLAHGTENKFSVDEVAREIRRTVGLNGRQAAANEKYYSHVKGQLAKDHPNMLPEDIEAEARERADRYKKRQLGYRARMIARTEIGNAYNAGALYGVRQAIDDGLIASATKVWVTSRNEANMCPGCAALEGTEIPIDEYFNYNGKLILAPLAHPNGKCTLEFKVQEAENPILESSDIEDIEIVGTDFDSETHEGAQENSHKHSIYRSTEIARSKIESPDYGRKISRLNENKKVSSAIKEESIAMLNHRSGTKYEDLAYIDSRDGTRKRRDDYDVERQVLPSEKMKSMVRNAPDYTIIAIHNHPESSLPSISDIISAHSAKYKYGLIACHNGGIIKYKTDKQINPTAYYSAFAKYEKSGYTKDALKMFIKEVKRAGIEIEVLT